MKILLKIKKILLKIEKKIRKRTDVMNDFLFKEREINMRLVDNIVCVAVVLQFIAYCIGIFLIFNSVVNNN